MCEKGLFTAIKYFGSQRALAKAMGVTQQTVSRWLNGERKMPGINALQLFVKAQGTITLADLFQSPQSIIKMIEKSCFFLKCPATALPIASIQVNDFICPKYTDTNNPYLLGNKDYSLSSPLLIDANHQLITCECRLRASQLLGHHTVSVHRVNLNEVVQGHYSLLPLTQALPISEKVAVGLAIEQAVGNRQGKRIDLQLVDTHPQVARGTKTRAVAAKLIGFDSDFLYRKAKFVIKRGLPNVIQAMDNQDCSIIQAQQIASLPQQEQQAALVSLFDQENNHPYH